MPRLAPKSLVLETKDRKELWQILSRHSTPQQIALRAKIILLADEGRNHHEIARELEISLKMARLWRKRWMEGQTKELPVAERLCDAQRSGTPAKFELEQVLHLFKLACDDPQDYNRPISQWTNPELAQEMVQQKIVEEISSRQVGRLLAEAELQPHQTGYWLNPPPDQNFDAKVTDICQVYLNAQKRASYGERTISLDEMTGIQALQRTAPDLTIRRA